MLIDHKIKKIDNLIVFFMLPGSLRLREKALLKLSCDSSFQRAFTACVFVFEVITLV